MNDFSIFFPRQHHVSTPAELVRFFGIDLGTTNSTIAEIVWDPGQPFPVTARCLEIKQDTMEGIIYNITVPSMAAIFRTKVYIGEGARRLRHLAADFGLAP